MSSTATPPSAPPSSPEPAAAAEPIVAAEPVVAAAPVAAPAAPEPQGPPDLEPYRSVLRKRGFRQDDPYLHECPKCHEKRAVEKWIIVGKGGGRDIDLCGACGQTWSWRQRPLREEREIDPDFDLRTFLKM